MYNVNCATQFKNYWAIATQGYRSVRFRKVCHFSALSNQKPGFSSLLFSSSNSIYFTAVNSLSVGNFPYAADVCRDSSIHSASSRLIFTTTSNVILFPHLDHPSSIFIGGFPRNISKAFYTPFLLHTLLILSLFLDHRCNSSCRLQIIILLVVSVFSSSAFLVISINIIFDTFSFRPNTLSLSTPTPID